MTVATGRHIENAAPAPENGHTPHPLANREVRTKINHRLRDKGIPVKVCSQCLKVKAHAAFGKYKSSLDGLKSYCLACKAAMHAKRQATDPVFRAKASARTKAWNAANQERRRAWRLEYQTSKRTANRAKNADKVQDPNVMKRCAGQCGRVLPETEFRLNRGNKDGLRHQCRACCDALARARRACLEAYGDPIGQVCYLCGEAIFSEPQVDHVIPQSRGGWDTADNVRWTHADCNSRRQTKPLTAEQVKRLATIRPQGVTS
jgi:hypothetical protein